MDEQVDKENGLMDKSVDRVWMDGWIDEEIYGWID